MAVFYARLVIRRSTMGKYNFFRIYDRLIENIDEDILIEEHIEGVYWTAIRTKDGLGLAKRFDEESRPRTIEGSLVGRKLKEVAELSKSFNLREASSGMAAINAYYNTRSNGDRLGLTESTGDAFQVYKKEIVGKKVVVVGHFPFIEKELEGICDLKILERFPQEGDYPDSACEYLIPECDYLFMTYCTLVNKTFPRLYELGKDSKIVMVGPSTPMAEFLLEEGVFDLSGFIPLDIDKCIGAIRKPECGGLFSSGNRVSLNNM